MTLSMTLRRFAPGTEPSEPGDDAAEFALGLKGIKLLEDDALLHFFEHWHVVHYLSSGEVWEADLPAGFLLGGTDWHEIHPEEDPPRLLSPAEVRAAHAHLTALPHDLLDARLTDLHAPGCEVQNAPQSPEDDGLVRGAFGQMRDFLAAAVEARQAVLMTLT